jgi:hypothetical protein
VGIAPRKGLGGHRPDHRAEIVNCLVTAAHPDTTLHRPLAESTAGRGGRVGCLMT